MKLFKILERHCSQKDSAEFVRQYVIAEDESKFFDYLDKDQYELWSDDDTEYEVWDESYNMIGKESRTEIMKRVRGDYHWDDASYEDGYYGITHLGWDDGITIASDDAETLIRLEIALDWR